MDAVCINQTDQAEKQQQLPLMGEIYTLSKSVYIWLGEGTTGTDRAMAYLSRADFEKYYYGPAGPRPFSAALAIFRSRWSRTKHLLPLKSEIPIVDAAEFDLLSTHEGLVDPAAEVDLFSIQEGGLFGADDNVYFRAELINTCST